MEKWKELDGFNGVYSVSDLGRVRNNKTNKILTQGLYDNGYLGVSLQKNKKNVRYRVHRLVAMCFVPNPSGYTQVNHKDEDKMNNTANNLEWCTPAYNISYGTRTERMKKALGHRVAAYDLSGNKVGEFESIIEGARQLKCNEANIRKCLKGIYTQTKGYTWHYAI